MCIRVVRRSLQAVVGHTPRQTTGESNRNRHGYLPPQGDRGSPACPALCWRWCVAVSSTACEIAAPRARSPCVDACLLVRHSGLRRPAAAAQGTFGQQGACACAPVTVNFVMQDKLKGPGVVTPELLRTIFKGASPSRLFVEPLCCGGCPRPLAPRELPVHVASRGALLTVAVCACTELGVEKVVEEAKQGGDADADGGDPPADAPAAPPAEPVYTNNAAPFFAVIGTVAPALRCKPCRWRASVDDARASSQTCAPRVPWTRPSSWPRSSCA
jgi:hypothetical protein